MKQLDVRTGGNFLVMSLKLLRHYHISDIAVNLNELNTVFKMFIVLFDMVENEEQIICEFRT